MATLFEQIEREDISNRQELNKREGEIIREIGTLNMRVASRTIEEYYETNKEQITDKHKIYCNENKDKISENKKVYYENNKEEITEKHKIYYENNKDKLLNYAKYYGKTYYENNKNKYKEYYNNKKSPKHIQLLENI